MQIKRCSWCASDPQYIDYHDNEWGVPVDDDKALFEFLVLESFQAGLSWITILRKREAFRLAFDSFDYHKIANYSEDKRIALKANQGIVRNKLKIKAATTNANAFIAIQNEFGSFSNYFWAFTEGKVIHNNWEKSSDAPAETPLSIKISKDLKKRGFTFVGPTIIYAFMQAVGMVNDHVEDCFRFKELSSK